MTKIDIFYFACASSVVTLMTGCIAPDPPPFPLNSSADPQVQSSSKTPRFSGHDETTEQIKIALSGTQEAASSGHDMNNMPGMKHGEMQHGSAPSPEKKALVEEMKNTSDEMKATSDELKRKSDEMKSQPIVYTCPMHSQVQSDKPGKCPICGMTLIKKNSHEGH